ncbi:MAG: acyl-ACP--UDP-N-acetylglucosamine O-acyltransferase [Crocinitomicaceae bacterium]|nr:acyl-ACP--UDP-N-acetylglucosamine O-acyltransferase [Crocinitomicaceae bacterium]MBK8926108.1 acyl-ACP--UDP-N-acetylglucosamine O-acyltransferase [Crocinitomicaceae bacterium]
MISNLAQIHPKAKLGNNVSVGPFSVIHDDVEIGDGTVIESNVVIYSGARIGKNCKIYPGAVISAIPQDLKFNHEYTTTEIGDNTVLRECVTIHRGTVDKMKTVVGSNCLIMCYVHIAHDSILGNHVIIANYSGVAGHCLIEDWAIIEGMCGLQQFTRVGEHSFIAGMTQVRKDVPPYIKVAREPITFAGVNAVGLRRRGASDETVRLIEDIYRNLFILNNSIPSGIAAIEKEIKDCDEKRKVLEFIKSSERGIVKGPI